MADSHDDAIIPVKKNKGGRPKKGPDLSQVIQDLQDQVANMQKAALANQAANADRFERVQQKVTLDLIPEASKTNPPGSYVQLGVDSSGSPIIGKVRWTKEMIEKTYPAVTFTPMREFTCGPHGVLYRIGDEIGKPVTVPSIVKDLYDETMKTEKQESEKYKRWTPAEDAAYSAQALESPPGVGVKSRVARVGYGLSFSKQSPEGAPETPAQ